MMKFICIPGYVQRKKTVCNLLRIDSIFSYTIRPSTNAIEIENEIARFILCKSPFSFNNMFLTYFKTIKILLATRYSLESWSKCVAYGVRFYKEIFGIHTRNCIVLDNLRMKIAFCEIFPRKLRMLWESIAQHSTAIQTHFRRRICAEFSNGI